MTNPVGIPNPPIDQFKDAKGKPWGTKFDAGNCWAATSSECVEFATGDKLHPTPPEFRAKSGNTKRLAGYITDVSAGARAYGIHEGTDDPYVPSFKVYIGLGWDRFVAKLENPLMAFVVPTDYQKVPDNLSENPNFDGGHSLAVFGGTLKDEGNGVRSVLIHDPIHGKAKRYPLFVLQDAAQKIAHDQGLPKGSIFATQFRQAIPKPPPPPPPPPPPDDETDAQKIARLTTERDVALTALAIANSATQAAIDAKAVAESERDDLQARGDQMVATWTAE